MNTCLKDIIYIHPSIIDASFFNSYKTTQRNHLFYFHIIFKQDNKIITIYLIPLYTQLLHTKKTLRALQFQPQSLTIHPQFYVFILCH